MFILFYEDMLPSILPILEKHPLSGRVKNKSYFIAWAVKKLFYIQLFITGIISSFASCLWVTDHRIYALQKDNLWAWTPLQIIDLPWQAASCSKPNWITTEIFTPIQGYIQTQYFPLPDHSWAMEDTLPQLSKTAGSSQQLLQAEDKSGFPRRHSFSLCGLHKNSKLLSEETGLKGEEHEFWDGIWSFTSTIQRGQRCQKSHFKGVSELIIYRRESAQRT